MSFKVIRNIRLAFASYVLNKRQKVYWISLTEPELAYEQAQKILENPEHKASIRSIVNQNLNGSTPELIRQYLVQNQLEGYSRQDRVIDMLIKNCRF